jgi:DNA-binding response OmpR family regulator
MLLDLISATLRLDGHQVLAHNNPMDALRAATQGNIDLLLTDIHTKPISGFEAAKRLNNAGCKAPVLFMSGYPAVTNAIAGGLGGRSILEKPFTAQQLRAAVAKALGRVKTSAQLPHIK